MDQQVQEHSLICSKCGSCQNENISSNLSTRTTQATCDSESVIKCRQWLEKCSISDCDSEYNESNSSVCTSQCITESSEDVESSTLELLKPEQSTGNSDPHSSSQFECSEHSNCEGRVCESCTKKISNTDLVSSNPNSYGDVNIQHSRHVVIGNVTYLTGTVNITQNSSTINQQTSINQILLNDPNLTKASDKLRIISRMEWLAQPPLNKAPLPEIPKYVIISHTASEEDFTQAKNVLLIRLVQTFHIESREWDDIAYNFLIGSDGNVYEGRGWGIQGAHTFGYNRKSIGISFVGCFMNHLPPAVSLQAAKSLIQRGVELGHIPKDYVLAGHCQCSPVESPGKRLYEEIKTWPHWREMTDADRS